MFLSVCKNVIASNNKRKWIDPAPTIRISDTKSGCAVDRAHRVGITDADGNIVAELVATKDGQPVISCGAKVGLITDHDVVILD